MRFVKQLVAVAAVAFAGGQAIVAVQGNDWLTLPLGVLTSVLSILVYIWVVRRTERRAVTELARAGAVSQAGLGTVLGVGMFVAVLVNIALFAEYHINGFGSATGAMGLVGFMAAAAVTEEVLFRGVLFRIIEERAGTWIALLLTGVAFGMMHLTNPDASLWGATAITIEAGFMFAAAYAATRNLWLPIGLHFGWNIAAGGIFSSVVSGNEQSKGLLETAMSGPALLTGGNFGPEASVFAVTAGVLMTAGFMWMAHRRGTIVPRRRRAAVAPATVTVTA
ncbi:CPBP family intramembrane glutamic endopeptidase [Micromonospora sp. NPDC047467]|uniref:CPBP family intramembrane glutamic endopeptidase n=1 Tax=Micromonospora sp. NPDC047467 TaxID=3154814 RepID=UPI0033D39786